MDSLQRAFFQMKFRIAFLERKGKAFEDLFSKIMGHASPGDFQAVRPYGNRGDLKCDGYRVSDRTVFQCYAPSAMKLPNLLAKMNEDFNGAVAHWGERMGRWSFVHNEDDGLPADAIQKLVDLGTANPTVILDQIGYPELFAVVMALPVSQIKDLFGSVPSQRTMAQLDYEALRPVVSLIQKLTPDDNPPLSAPSPAKLSANDLSGDAAELLRQGRRREPLVERFFNDWPDPSLGEEIAQGFRERYQALKMEGLSPDRIFTELQTFAGGMDGTPSHQAAVLAVMSYFFERCDIFEDNVEGGVGT
ncbi:MAG: ABC-three component system protein [Gemmobacter sp.]